MNFPALGWFAIACAATVSLSACGTEDEGKQTGDQPADALTGKVSILLLGPVSNTDEDDTAVGDPCAGGFNGNLGHDYSEFSSGADVTLYDQDHKVIGAMTLPAGEIEVAWPFRERVCRFDMIFEDVPTDKIFYTIEVAGNDLGRLDKSALKEGAQVAVRDVQYDGSY